MEIPRPARQWYSKCKVAVRAVNADVVKLMEEFEKSVDEVTVEDLESKCDVDMGGMEFEKVVGELYDSKRKATTFAFLKLRGDMQEIAVQTMSWNTRVYWLQFGMRMLWACDACAFKQTACLWHSKSI